MVTEAAEVELKTEEIVEETKDLGLIEVEEEDMEDEETARIETFHQVCADHISSLEIVDLATIVSLGTSKQEEAEVVLAREDKEVMEVLEVVATETSKESP